MLHSTHRKTNAQVHGRCRACWTVKLCPDGRERKTMKLTQAINRANSHFRHWGYRKTIGKPFPLRFAVAQWLRRLAFELAGSGSGA